MRYTFFVHNRVLGVLGGNDVDEERLVAWCKSATHVYAADSGADRIIALGIKPVVVGDFDSFKSVKESPHLRLVQSLDQETTDCDKLLTLAHDDGHNSITLAATEGDLPDHVVSTYSGAVSAKLTVRFAFRRGIGHIVRGGEKVSVSTGAGQRTSLIPLTPCIGATLTGVRWPLSNNDIAMGGRLSVSNETTGGLVEATLKQGAAILFLETPEIVW